MRPEDFNRLRANQYFLVEELERRGILVAAVDIENELLEARVGNHSELLLDIDSSLMSYPASVITGEKPVAKALLIRAGVQVPRGATFKADEGALAASFARELGFPVVVKPPCGSQGEGVYTHLEFPSEVKEVFDRAYSEAGSVRLMVEEQFDGQEFRIFITAHGDYAVLLRDPAYVVGDGMTSIEDLVASENYSRTHPRTNCLCPILLDAVAVKFLRKRGITPAHIPARGQKVYVRGNSNVKSGAMAEDITDLVHPSAVEIALRALRAFPGLPYAGVDFMCRDITSSQDDASYRVIEVNSLPGIGMHINPGKGRSRNVAGMIVDMMFPETKAELRKAA